MADQKSGGISWTETTWNPVRGCSRVSEGCRECYAERDAGRWGGPGQPYDGLVKRTDDGPRWTGDVRMIEERLLDPIRWQRKRLIFVNSMSDLFHEKLPAEEIARVFAVMALAPQHTFQTLTKRSGRMAEMMRDPAFINEIFCAADAIAAKHLRQEMGINFIGERMRWPLPNVWLGVSVENQKVAEDRIPELISSPAEVRWISAEPLLGPVEITAGEWWDHRYSYDYFKILYPASRPPIDWVVVGGESGSDRPMDLAWARALRDECKAAGVAFYMKQLGDVGAVQIGATGAGKKLADFPADLQIQEYPDAAK